MQEETSAVDGELLRQLRTTWCPWGHPRMVLRPDLAAMKRKPAYLVGTNPYSFRPGVAALIIGVELVQPHPEATIRPAFKCLFADGAVDWTPTSDVGNYLITEDQERRDVCK